MLRPVVRASGRIRYNSQLRFNINPNRLNGLSLRALSSKNSDQPSQIPPQQKPVDENYNRRMLQLLGKHLWPDSSVPNSKEIKTRVVTSMCFMVGAKVVTIQVPFIFRDLIDYYGEKISDVANSATGDANSIIQGVEMSEGTVNALNTMLTEPVLAVPLSLVLGYGIARTAASASQELRSAIFSNVAQQAIRRVSGEVFEHLLARDLQFHLDRKIGTLSRVIDRGGRSIQFALSSMLFSVVPTALEIGDT